MVAGRLGRDGLAGPQAVREDFPGAGVVLVVAAAVEDGERAKACGAFWCWDFEFFATRQVAS